MGTPIPGPCITFLLVRFLALYLILYQPVYPSLFIALYSVFPFASRTYMQFCGNNAPMPNVNFTLPTSPILHPPISFPFVIFAG